MFVSSYRIKLRIRRHRCVQTGESPTTGYAHEPTSTRPNFALKFYFILNETTK